jgi:pimeloyl-ACP methyl ester carboxylesterase
MTDQHRIDTGVGRLHVEVEGSGPPALLWHSLLVDSRQWQRVRPALAATRTLVVVDGPGHGRSGPPAGPFDHDDCAAAALTVLDRLVTGPVDWLGNAWGGHVGLAVAAGHPDRLRSLVLISTPVTPLTPAQLRRNSLLVAAYRLVGARPLAAPVLDALLAPGVRRTDPEAVAVVRAGFTGAARAGMHRAVRSMMLDRTDLTPLLPRASPPALLLAGTDDPMWPLRAVEATAAAMPDARVVAVEGARHLPPLERPDEVVAAVTAFWNAVENEVMGSPSEKLIP